MLWTALTTNELSGAERYEYWESMMSLTQVPAILASDHFDDFQASSHLLDLGSIQVFTQNCPPLAARRTRALIRQSDPEVLQACLTVRGGIGLSQSGRHAQTKAGDLLLWDSSRPFSGSMTAAGHGGQREEVSTLIMQVPRSALPFHSDTLDRLTLTTMPGRPGAGALFGRYLTDLMEHASMYEEGDAVRLAGATLDLLSAALAQVARAEGCLPPETQQTVLRIRIEEFIQQHLGDPDLTPNTIAAVHRISTRYLHKLFQGQEATVAKRIRLGRLNRIHQDLADPRLGARSIGAIAAQWGFLEPRQFSRAFRAVYGLTPREHRSRPQGRHPVR